MHSLCHKFELISTKQWNWVLCVCSFFPLLFFVEKYLVIYTQTKGWKIHHLGNQHGGTYRSTWDTTRMHNMKRQLIFRDGSMRSSVELLGAGLAHSPNLVTAPALSQVCICHGPPMPVTLLHWVLIAPACFPATRKTVRFKWLFTFSVFQRTQG